jgi:hypothetical protein
MTRIGNGSCWNLSQELHESTQICVLAYLLANREIFVSSVLVKAA